MKSFASGVRDAVAREDEHWQWTRDTRRAALTGLALSCGTVTLAGGQGLCLTMRTDHAGTGRLISRLLKAEFQAPPALRIRRSKRLGGVTTFEIALQGEDARGVMRQLSLTPLGHGIPRQCLKTRRSRDAFLRGVFLGCGTMTDPEKAYQMEFAFTVQPMAQAFARFLQKLYGLRAGVSGRRDAHIVYLRGSDDIITVLSCIGAHGAILELENVRIMKEARNRANRAANCDSGNIAKMLGAAQRQLEAIGVIEKTIGLDALPDALREVAIERKLHEDASLEAIGEMLEPPVGKSGVHHRLSRIVALARTLESKKEGEP